MEDVKYVKIKKATKPTFWYSSKIGEIYKVEDYSELDYLVLNVEENYYLIKKEDCVELKQVKRPAKVGENILIVNPIGNTDYKCEDVLTVESINKSTVFTKEKESEVSTWYREYVVLEEPEEEEKPKTATFTVDINGEQLEKLLENIGHLAFKVVELERRVEELEEKEDKNMTVGGFPYEPYL